MLSRPLTPTGYPHGIYYCSQTLENRVLLAGSDDGGVTFGPWRSHYTSAMGVNGVDGPTAPGTCGGLHGHVRRTPDGTGYFPPKTAPTPNNGQPNPGWLFSTDNGLTWFVPHLCRTARQSARHTDPSVRTERTPPFTGICELDGQRQDCGFERIAFCTGRKSQMQGLLPFVCEPEFAESESRGRYRAASLRSWARRLGDKPSPGGRSGSLHLYCASMFYDSAPDLDDR